MTQGGLLYCQALESDIPSTTMLLRVCMNRTQYALTNEARVLDPLPANRAELLLQASRSRVTEMKRSKLLGSYASNCRFTTRPLRKSDWLGEMYDQANPGKCMHFVPVKKHDSAAFTNFG